MYRNYILPDGRQSGMTEVRVDERLMSHLGEPKVDYEGFDDLFHRTLKLPSDMIPRVTAVNTSERPILRRELGHHIHFTRGMVVAPRAANTLERGIDEVVLHEAKHVGDSINHKALSALDYGLGIAVRVPIGLGAWVAVEASSPLFGAWLIAMGLPIKMAYQYDGIAERRAHAFGRDPEMLQQYAGLLSFSRQTEHHERFRRSEKPARG